MASKPVVLFPGHIGQQAWAAAKLAQYVFLRNAREIGPRPRAQRGKK